MANKEKVYLEFEPVISNLKQAFLNSKSGISKKDLEFDVTFNDDAVQQQFEGIAKELTRVLNGSFKDLDLSEILPKIASILKGDMNSSKLNILGGLTDQLKTLEQFSSNALNIGDVIKTLNKEVGASNLPKFLDDLSNIYSFVDSLGLQKSEKTSVVNSILNRFLSSGDLTDAFALKNIQGNGEFKNVNKFAVSAREARERLLEELEEWNNLSERSKSQSPITNSIMGFMSRIETLTGDDILTYLDSKLNDPRLQDSQKKIFSKLQQLIQNDDKKGFLDYYNKWLADSVKSNDNPALTRINRMSAVTESVVKMTRQQIEEAKRLKEEQAELFTKDLKSNKSITPDFTVKTTGETVQAVSEEEQYERNFADAIANATGEIKEKNAELEKEAELVKKGVIDSSPEEIALSNLETQIIAVKDAINEKTDAFINEGTIVSNVVESEIKDLNRLKLKIDEISELNGEEDKIDKITGSSEAAEKRREAAEKKREEQRKENLKGALVIDQPKENKKEESKPRATPKRIVLPDSKDKKDKRTPLQIEAESLKDIDTVIDHVNSGYEEFGRINKNILTDVTNLGDALKKEADALRNVETRMTALSESDTLRLIAKPRFEEELKSEKKALAQSEKELNDFRKDNAKYLVKSTPDQKGVTSKQLREAFKATQDMENDDDITKARKRIKLLESYNEAIKAGVSNKSLQQYAPQGYTSEQYAKDTQLLEEEFKKRQIAYDNHAKKIEDLQNKLIDIENLEKAKKAHSQKSIKKQAPVTEKNVIPISDQSIGAISQEELDNLYEESLEQAKVAREEYVDEIENLFQEKINHQEKQYQYEEPKVNYETITEEAQKAAEAKERFIDANINVPNSVYESVTELDQEAIAFEKIAKQAQAAADAKDNFIKSNKGIESHINYTDYFETVPKNIKTGYRSNGHANNSQNELSWEMVEGLYERLISNPSYIQKTEALFGKGHPELSDYQTYGINTDNLKLYEDASVALEEVRKEMEYIFSMSQDDLELAGLSPEDLKEYIDRYKSLVKELNNLKLVITAPSSEENFLLSLNRATDEVRNKIPTLTEQREKIEGLYNSLLNDKKFVNDNELQLQGKIQLQDLDQADITTITTSALHQVGDEIQNIKQELSSMFTDKGQLIPEADVQRATELFKRYKELREEANRFIGIITSSNSEENTLYNIYLEKNKQQLEEKKKQEEERKKIESYEASIRNRALSYSSKNDFITGSDIDIKKEYKETDALDTTDRGRQYQEAVKHANDLRNIIKDITYDPVTGEMKDLNELTSLELEGLKTILDDYDKWVDVAKRLKSEIVQINSEESKWVKESSQENTEDKRQQSQRKLKISNISKLSDDKKFIQGTDVDDLSEYDLYEIASDRIKNYKVNKSQAEVLRKTIKDFLYDETTGAEKDISTLNDKQLKILESHVERYQKIINDLNRLKNEITSSTSPESIDLEIKKQEEGERTKNQKASMATINSNYKQLITTNKKLEDSISLKKYKDIEGIEKTENFELLAKKYTELGEAKQKADEYFKDGKLINNEDLVKAQEAINVYNQLAVSINNIIKAITSKGSQENNILDAVTKQNNIQKNIISGKYQKLINTGSNAINTYGYRADGVLDETQIENTNVIQLKNAIDELKTKKEQFDQEWTKGNEANQETLKKLRTEIDETGQEVEELIGKVKAGIPQASDKQMSLLANNISKFFVDNPHITADSTNELVKYYKELTSGASISVDRLKQLGVAFDNVQIKERNLGNLGGNVFNTMLGKIREGLAYLSTKFSFYQLVNQFRQGIQIVHQFDDALTEMQKVSDETIYTLQRYQTTTFETARTIGASALQVQQSTADFMRLGESLEEAAKSARAANVLMNVSEFSSIDEATKSLIAMSAAYNDLSKENIIDKLNEVGNNYAISTSEAATALQSSASALKTANNNMDEALALVTAGNAVVQDATKVGTGMRTIALRLTGTKSAKDELEELGEDTDSMLTTQSKLRETIMEATAVEANNFKGFDILDDNGNYKSTYEIMLGIANIYNDILEADKKFGRNNANLLLETVAGKVRANIAASIFQNPDVLARAYQSSQGAEGSAMEENEKYMASISGHTAQIQTSWQELWANTANRDLINMFIDLGKAALDAANNIGLVPSALGLFTAYSSIMRTGAGKGLLSAFFKDLVAIGTSMEGLDDQGQQMVAFIRQDLPNAFTQSGQAAEKFKTRLGDLTKAGKGLISILANPAFLAPAAGFLILAGAAIIKKRQDDLRKENLENARSSATSMKEQNEQLNKQVDSYTELKNKLDSNILSEEEEVQVKQQILDIQNSITEKYGDHSAELDLINGKLYDQLEILKAIGAEEAKEDYFKNYEGYQAALEEYTNNQRVYTIDISGSEKVNKLLEQSGLQIREILNEQGFGIGAGIGAGGDVESLITTYENARKELQDYLISLDTRTDAKEIQRVNEALSQTSKNLSELYQIRDDNKATALLGLREGLWSRQITSQDIVSRETGQARTGYGILTDLEETSNKLADAFMRGDYSKIDELREKFIELQAERDQFLEVDINSPFAILFDQINEELLETQFRTYDAQEAIDSLFGKKAISRSNQFADNLNGISKYVNALKKRGFNRVDIQNMFATDIVEDYERTVKGLMHALGFAEGQQADFINLLVSTGIITGDLSDVTNEASQSYNEFSQAVAKGIENVSTLQSVMSESVSGKGISTQNIEAFRKMYSDYGIETEQALERTANGYHVNERSMYQLNEQYKSMLHMQYADALNDQYNALQKVNEEYQRAVANGADLSGYAAQKDAIYEQIQSLDDLMMQYQSANSAYQQWLTAQSGNGTRDMYDSIYGGYDTIKEEIEHGWAGSDKVRSWLDLIYNDEGDNAFDPWIASATELNDKFKEVTKTIEGTGGKSIADFFTVDENGKSTSLGVFNFFDAVLEKQKEVGREFVRIGENGEYIFDFDKNGDYQIADLLGIDVEAVQAILRAAYDAGFTVNLDQPIYSIERLRDAAEEAKESLGFDIDINTDNIEQVDSDLERLQEYRDTLVKDQSIPLNVKTEKLEELDKLIQYTIAHKRELIEKSDIYFSTNVEDVNDKIEKLQKNIQKRSKQINWELPDEFTSDYLIKTNSVEGLNEMAKKIQEYLNLHPELDSSEVEYLNELFDLILEKKGLLESPTPVRVTVDTIQEAEKGIGEMNKELQLMKEYSAQGLDVEFSDDFKHYVDLIVAMPDEWKQKWNIDPNASAEDLLELYKEKEFDIQIGVDYSGDPKQKLQEEYGSTPTKINPISTITENREFTYKTIETTTTANDQSSEVIKDAQEVAEDFSNGEDGKGNYDATLEVKGAEEAQEETEQTGDALQQTGRMNARPTISIATNGAFGIINDLSHSILNIPAYRKITVDFSVLGRSALDSAVSLAERAHNTLKGLSPVNGTAHFQGTAFARGSLSPVGNAFKSGDWGVPKDQTALVNEVGEEIIVRDGKWFVANGGNAGFVGLKKGDVVFNSEQTKELLENGYVTGRKRASIVGFTNGTAYSSGSGSGLRPTVTSYSMGGKKTNGSGSGSGSSGSGNSGNSSANDNANDFLETLDEIEIKIDRLERKISNLDTIAGNTYYQYGVRNEALIADLSKVGEEIDLQRKAYQRYIRQANSVGLSADWAQKVREGAINIEDVKDQDLWDKISKYREWYEKALDCRDAIQGLMQTEADLWQQRFDLDQNWYENEMTWYQHESDIMETMISTMESKGRILTDRYYKVQLQDQENILALLKEEKEYLETDMEQALKSGDIDVYSEGWYGMKTAIDDVCSSIEETEGTIADLQKSIRELRWENFDYILETVDALNEEIEFLYGLLNEDKMFDDKGHITNQGLAGLGLYTSSYNVYLQEAQKYADEIKEVNKELANDPYNKDIIDRQKELYKAHQDAIKGANDQKQAIADLIEEGIKKQIDSLKDLIDKYQDLMDEEKDQIDYAKRIADAQKEVNTIQKQLNAYERDDSEEGATRRQQLRNQLKQAQENLADTEEERRISETKKMLGELQEQYEDILNTRLDNIDKLIADVITEVNNNSSIVSSTITEEADKVGYTISQPLVSGFDNLSSNLVTLNSIGSNIASGVQSIISYLSTGAEKTEEEATTEINAHDTMHEEFKQNQSSADSSATNKNSLTSNEGYDYGLYQQGWNMDEKGWFYINSNGEMSKNTMQNIGGTNYHFDSAGYMEKSKWVAQGSDWYHLDDYGRAQTGWQKINYNGKDEWFLFDNQGKMLTGLQSVNGKNYYLDPQTGVMAKNAWKYADGGWRYLNGWGESLAGWQKINYKGNDEWFLFDNQGKMLTGLQSVGGKSYYLDPSTGVMAKNKWISDGKYWRYFDGYGQAKTGWFYDSSAKKWAYLDPETNGGKLVNQWYYDEGLGAWYWLDGSGWMVLNGEFQTKDGKKWFDGHGRLLTGKGGAIAKNITGYKSGTDFVPKDDIYKLFEEGNEAIVTKTGTYRKLNMGDMVLNKQATDNLYAMANDPASFIRAWSKADIAKPVSTIGVNSNNNITMQFNLPNVQNATQFISEMKNNNQFIKWLQEVTLGQAAGHNILRKNAIKI